MRNRRTSTVGLMAVALLLGACDDATGPDPADTFDAEAALQDYRALEQILATDAFLGFRSLEGRTPFGGSASMGVVAALAGDDPRAFAFDLLDRVRVSATPAGLERAPLISDRTRGSTFIYDPSTDDYTLDPDRDGAPTTGVRFVLYEVDGRGTPIVEREIGYADLIDEGDGIGIESLSLLTLPLHVRTRIGPRVALMISGAWARGSLERPDGSEETLSGPTDIEVLASTSFLQERVVVTGIVDLPTGTSTLTDDEAFVAGAVAADLLPFRISHWGTGGGLGGRVAVAQPVGVFSVGASVSYRTSGDYEPRDGESSRYDPGDALRVATFVPHDL